MAKPGKPIGYRHGRWTITGPVQNDIRGTLRRTVYPVRCDCGTERVVILTARSQSCGCLNRENQSRLHFSDEDRSINDLYSMMRSDCKSRKSRRHDVFELTRDEFKEIIAKDCHYCGISPSNARQLPGRDYVFKYNGIDRIDSSKGYVLNNVVPCCKRCNVAKNNQTVAEFREWLERVARFQKLI